MSDNEKSGAPTSAPADLPAPAPAEAPVKAELPPAENTSASGAQPTSAPSASDTSGIGSFGSTRGSGLARGKRPITLAPSATPASSGGYRPTSIEVIAPASEYKNPFTGETSVITPRTNEPALQAAPAAPAPVVAPATPATPPATPPSAETAAPVSAADETSEEPELKILPPEQAKRQAMRWDASSSSGQAENRREERPTLRPDRERRDNREPRRDDVRREDRRFEPRSHQPHQEQRPQPQQEKKAGGIVGWFKGLFGGTPAETPAGGAPEPRREGEHGHHRRHRGGRGRGHSGDQRGFQGENRAPRPDSQQGGGGGDFGGGEHRRRRRRRGGRGRHHGEPRPEGHQGGGAI